MNPTSVSIMLNGLARIEFASRDPESRQEATDTLDLFARLEPQYKFWIDKARADAALEAPPNA